MQKLLKGLEQSLSFIEKAKKEKAKKAAEKKAAKEAKYGHASAAKRVVRKRGDSEEQKHLYTPQVKKSGRVHVVSKRKTDK